MTTYVNRWTVVLGWTALMTVAWTVLVPGWLSTSSFIMLCLTGPVLLVAGSALLSAQRPSPSIRQVRAMLDSEERLRADARIRG
jgi:hypothetical protein